MNRTIKISALFISILLSLSSYGETNKRATQKEINKAKDIENKMVGLSAEIYNFTAYFNLKMLNETEGGFYSLVRFKNDTIYESVRIVEAIPNKINQPLLYSFYDDIECNSDIKYVLYKILLTKPTKIIKSWKYDGETNTLITLTELPKLISYNNRNKKK